MQGNNQTLPDLVLDIVPDINEHTTTISISPHFGLYFVEQYVTDTRYRDRHYFQGFIAHTSQGLDLARQNFDQILTRLNLQHASIYEVFVQNAPAWVDRELDQFGHNHVDTFRGSMDNKTIQQDSTHPLLSAVTKFRFRLSGYELDEPQAHPNILADYFTEIIDTTNTALQDSTQSDLSSLTSFYNPEITSEEHELLTSFAW